MLKKIADLFFKNIGLKILALIISIILWYVVLNINDPEISKSFNCAVTVENAESLNDLGKTYEIVDGSTAYFNVRAPRSIIANLSSSDFKAVADMENLTDMSKIPIEVTATRYASQIEIMKRTENLVIETEDLMRAQYIIAADAVGEPAEGTVISSLSVSPNVLKLSGPASVVSTIDKVIATIHVDGVASAISDSVIPTLYDKEGNVVDTTKLVSNLSSVIVRAEILNVKEVPLTYETSGQPAEGYFQTGISVEPETIRIMGESADLNSISSIAIPTEVLNVEGATGNIDTTVDISAYLPDGVSLTENADKNIKVKIDIESAVTKRFRIPTANITVNGGSPGVEAVFAENEIVVEIEGLSEDLDNLRSADITGSIDISGFSTGDHKAALTLDLDEEKYRLAENVSVEFNLRRTN